MPDPSREHAASPVPFVFYATIRHGDGRFMYALGPFASHDVTLAHADALRVRSLRAEHTEQADLWFGTCRAPVVEDIPSGSLNDVLEVTPDDVGVTTRPPQPVPVPILMALSAEDAA